MKRIISFSCFLTIILFLNNNFYAQGFDLTAYQNFLQTHQNMQTSELLDMYPAGIFQNDLDINSGEIFYFDSIDVKYNLTDYEKSLIDKNGFVITQRLSKHSIGSILLDIHHYDLPVFVSTDAILYAYHISYDRILRDVELGYLMDNVENMLISLHYAFPSLVSNYSSTPEMTQELMDTDFYLTMALKLFGETIDPWYPENNNKINNIMTLVMDANSITNDTLFSSNCIVYDWSQFRPRGHYVSERHPQLANYFRTMMWLGRMELYLIKPSNVIDICQPQTTLDIRRQVIDANLVYELFGIACANGYFTAIDNVLKFFVGDQDNVTLNNLGYLRNAVQINSSAQLLDTLKVAEFQDTLRNQSFAYQLILSQLLRGDPFSPDSIVPASSFLLFGQRFVDDSYVSSSVVYDRISYLGQKICRLFPSALDPLFALGNDAAAQLLQPELDDYHYAANLAALRYLFDSFPGNYWESSLYKRWLHFIMTINPPPVRENLPPFMTTAAFWQEKMNTQLFSWAELRHDNLLYAKQAYTGWGICSYPYSYVEPFPNLYAELSDAGIAGYNYLTNLDFVNQDLKQRMLNYFTTLRFTCDTLQSIAEKELSDTPLSTEETSFLKNMVFVMETYPHTTYDGWYPNLMYNDTAQVSEGFESSNFIVADVHTTPTDCNGTPMGWISHAGTGPFDMGVVIAKIPGGEDCAFIGPVLSYREYVTTNFLRLTDDEWSSQYLYSSLRPDWVNLYLADSTGNNRGEGGTLITSAKSIKGNVVPSNLSVSNYPNPFNPSTIINYSVPYDLRNRTAELIIYDLQGQVVKHLIKQVLPAGNYITKWNGDSDGGSRVASGIYFYRLRIGDRQAIGKMNLIK